jgi:GTP-binding protein Era
MKTGYIAIIGEPNVGKSTLLNRLLGTKLSIVSDKPQTTRHKILGILTGSEYQCLFLDTPGIIEPAYELHQNMLREIRDSIEGADLVLWLVDPWFRPAAVFKEFVRLAGKKALIVVINKIDLVGKPELLPVIENLKQYKVREIIPVSALNGSGIGDLKECIIKELPEGPFLYPGEELSDRPERFFVAELVREEIFKRFKKEIPYSVAVAVEEFKEREQGKNYIRATIYVEKDSQKGILIGRNGKDLKHIGEKARRAIEDFLGRSVYLDLWVKVKDKWRKDRKFLKEIGY